MRKIFHRFIDDLRRVDRRAWSIGLTIAGIMLVFTSLYVIQWFIRFMYYYRKEGEFRAIMVALDTIYAKILDIGLVYYAMAAFAGGMIFMGILNWVGFGRQAKFLNWNKVRAVINGSSTLSLNATKYIADRMCVAYKEGELNGGKDE